MPSPSPSRKCRTREARLLGHLGEFLDRIVELVKDPNFWKALGDLLANIAAIIGVICLALMIFASGPAGWLVVAGIAASVAALGAHGAAMAMGHEDVGWDTLAFDLAGAAFGGLGLVAGNIIKGGRAVVQTGRALRHHAFRELRIADWASGVLRTGIGHLTVFYGKVLDWTAAIAGNTAAGADFGRSPHFPVIGPISDLWDAWSATGSSEDDAAAGTEADNLLVAAGDSFVNGLDAEYGAAA